MARKGSLLLAALLAGVSVVTATAAPAQSRPAGGAPVVPPLGFTTRTLANGLTVYAMRDTRTANVSVQMWYNVGAKDDPAGRSGFAHLFEHILSQITRNMPLGELARIVEEQSGGTRNASTDFDYTNYYETVPANRLEAMLWAHAERMGRSVLDQSVFDTQRAVVMEEMRLRVLSQPYGRLEYFHLFDTGYTSHPYRRSPIGTMADLRAATLEDARAFHANFYRPDNATLVVSGNFDQAQLDRWVDQYLGVIPRPNRPILRQHMVEQPRTGARSMTIYGPNVPLPAIMFSWQRPRVNHPDSAALAVLNQVLSGGQSSRLYQSLVYERQLAQSATVQDYGQEDAGIIGIEAVVANGRDIGETEAALAAEVARVRDQPITAAELSEARNELVSQLLFSRETPNGRAFELGQSLTSANDPNWGDRQLAAIQNVTPADVQRVARRYLSDSNRVSIRYLDRAAQTGAAAPDIADQPTDPALGRSFPPATGTPNVLAPESERAAPPAAGERQPFNAPAFAERRLANGMRVVVARSTTLPIVTANLVFGGGSVADPTGRPGVASMMTRLVDNGAAGMTAPQLAARIEALGARIGATANVDSSAIFVAAPAATIGDAGTLLRQIVREPSFAAEELERERRRTLDQLRVNMRDPTFVNQQVSLRAVYGDAPYGAPVGGSSASLAAITRDELVAYHRNWWRPDNATLIITGGLAPDDAFALAERMFGDWAPPNAAMPTLPQNRAGTASAPRVIVVDNPDSDQAAVSVVTRGIARNDPDYYPLVLANSVLGGSSTGRLFQEIRVRRALSYGSYSQLVTNRDEGALVAIAQTRNNAAPEVAQVIMAELRRLRDEPLAPDVLRRRQNLVGGAFGRQVETTQGLGGFLANLAVQGLPMDEFGRYLPGIEAVTPQQVAASLAAEIDPAQASIVIVGRASEFLEALRAQHPNVEVIPIGQLDLGSATLRGAAAATGTQ